MSTDRIPPHSGDLEQSVLATMLQDSQAAAGILATVAPEVFYLDAHREIFAAAQRCGARGLGSDPGTVGEELHRRGRLLEVTDTLARILEGLPSPAWPHHVRQLHELAERRRIIAAAERIAATGYAGQEPVSEYREQAEALLFQATQRDQGGEILAPKQLAASLDAEAAPFALTTGLSLLDDPQPILAAGRLVVLAGRPGIGKTALACAILARHALARPAVPALFFSCEQTAREVAERILALHTGSSLYAIQTGTPPLEAVERLSGGGLHLSEAGAPPLAQLLGQIRAARAQHGIKLVVVDHIGKVTGGRKETRTLEVGDVARGLKAIAKDLGIPVLALCQLNRAVESRNVKRPVLADLRESGEIEQEADAVVFAWTAEENPHRLAEVPMFLTLAKNRHGAPGEVKAIFDRPRLRFREAD